MYEALSNFPSILLVGIGAIAGSWMRMHLINYCNFRFSSSYFGTFFVNISASFALGFVYANQKLSDIDLLKNNSPVFILICVGFLGSLSTFSTFIIDLLNTILDRNMKLFFLLALFSIIGGLFAVFLGFAVGDARNFEFS